MDYSKVGTKLYKAIVNNKSTGSILKDSVINGCSTLPALKNCDSVIAKNTDAFVKAFEGKPLSVTANHLNKFGNLVHRFQGLYLYKNASEKTAANVEKYFKDLKISGLYRAYKSGGLDGVYTLFLNKAASGVPIEEFDSLNKIFIKEYKKYGMDAPELDILLKGIVNKSDFEFLKWKSKGFTSPKQIKMPPFTDESYKVTQKYHETHRIDSKIPDGYRDPGRQFSYKRNGELEGKYKEAFNRETLIVDRSQDKVLNMVSQRLKSIISRNPYMTENEKIRTLFTCVRDIFGIKDGPAYANCFETKPMLIGDIMSSGAGCCRHMALSAKLLGDDLGMNISMVRGRLMLPNGRISSHIWNEITTSDGNKIIFDAAQRKLINLKSGDDFIKKYYTQDKKLMYTK